MALRSAPQIDLFKKEKSAEEFLSLLPPDARPIILPDGSVVIRQGGKTYQVPRSINAQVRNIVSNVDPLGQRTRTIMGSSSAGTGTEIVDDGGLYSYDINLNPRYTNFLQTKKVAKDVSHNKNRIQHAGKMRPGK